MPRTQQMPIGLRLTRSAKIVERAFNDALAQVGGSGPMWMILIALKTGAGRNQNDLAASIGIRGATLSHHLTTMEDSGLITRRRDPDNRRVHIVEMTAAGDSMFHRLREVVAGFDRRLRRGIPAADRTAFEDVLDRLVTNAQRELPESGGVVAPSDSDKSAVTSRGS